MATTERAARMRERRAEQAERNRRARVVHGWAFRDLPPEQVAAIRAYVSQDGPVPPGYERLHESVR